MANAESVLVLCFLRVAFERRSKVLRGKKILFFRFSNSQFVVNFIVEVKDWKRLNLVSYGINVSAITVTKMDVKSSQHYYSRKILTFRSI